jgi:hypothetical protein
LLTRFIAVCCSEAPKAHHMPAQGIALGSRLEKDKALKGRDNV